MITKILSTILSLDEKLPTASYINIDIGTELKKAKKRANYPHMIEIMDIIEQKPYTMIEVRSSWIIGVGFSKCRPRDIYNKDIGIKIALFRAVRDLASKSSR